MAAVLTTQVFAHAGATAITYTTSGSGGLATSGNTAPTGQDLALLVKNGSGGSLTVNMVIPATVTVDGMAVATPLAITVATGADQLIPLVAARYADATTGLATFGLSTVTSVSVAVITTTS